MQISFERHGHGQHHRRMACWSRDIAAYDAMVEVLHDVRSSEVADDVVYGLVEVGGEAVVQAQHRLHSAKNDEDAIRNNLQTV